MDFHQKYKMSLKAIDIEVEPLDMYSLIEQRVKDVSVPVNGNNVRLRKAMAETYEKIQQNVDSIPNHAKEILKTGHFLSPTGDVEVFAFPSDGRTVFRNFDTTINGKNFRYACIKGCGYTADANKANMQIKKENYGSPNGLCREYIADAFLLALGYHTIAYKLGYNFAPVFVPSQISKLLEVVEGDKKVSVEEAKRKLGLDSDFYQMSYICEEHVRFEVASSVNLNCKETYEDIHDYLKSRFSDTAATSAVTVGRFLRISKFLQAPMYRIDDYTSCLEPTNASPTEIFDLDGHTSNFFDNNHPRFQTKFSDFDDDYYFSIGDNTGLDLVSHKYLKELLREAIGAFMPDRLSKEGEREYQRMKEEGLIRNGVGVGRQYLIMLSEFWNKSQKDAFETYIQFRKNIVGNYRRADLELFSEFLVNDVMSNMIYEKQPVKKVKPGLLSRLLGLS